MAKFKLERTVTGSSGPSWAELAQLANSRSVKSVELVSKKVGGKKHIEVRVWKGLRDDTDEPTRKVKSNSPKAPEDTEFSCGGAGS